MNHIATDNFLGHLLDFCYQLSQAALKSQGSYFESPESADMGPLAHGGARHTWAEPDDQHRPISHSR